MNYSNVPVVFPKPDKCNQHKKCNQRKNILVSKTWNYVQTNLIVGHVVCRCIRVTGKCGENVLYLLLSYG